MQLNIIKHNLEPICNIDLLSDVLVQVVSAAERNLPVKATLNVADCAVSCVLISSASYTKWTLYEPFSTQIEQNWNPEMLQTWVCLSPTSVWAGTSENVDCGLPPQIIVRIRIRIGIRILNPNPIRYENLNPNPDPDPSKLAWIPDPAPSLLQT